MSIYSSKEYGTDTLYVHLYLTLRRFDSLKIIIIIIIIRTFVTRAVSANILNLRCRQSLVEEDGGSGV